MRIEPRPPPPSCPRGPSELDHRPGQLRTGRDWGPWQLNRYSDPPRSLATNRFVGRPPLRLSELSRLGALP